MEENKINDSEELVSEEVVEVVEVVEVEEQAAESSVEVLDSLAALTSKIDEMNTLFVDKIRYTAHNEKIVDQMHEELQQYKADLYSQLVRPILSEIIEIRESILRVADHHVEENGEDAQIPVKKLSIYSYELEEILLKNNIHVYQGEAGDKFNPQKHRVIKKTPTADEELHGKIAQSLSSGYEYLGRVLSAEKVEVYAYEKPVNVEDEDKND